MRVPSHVVRLKARWLGLLAIIALVVAACSPSDGADTTEPTDTTQAETSTTAEPETTEASESTTTTGAEADPLEELIVNAQADGELSVYWGVDDETATRVKEAFEATFDGVTFNFERVPGNVDVANRFNGEMEAGSCSADILVNTDTNFMADAMERGLIMPITEWNAPSVEEVPDVFKGEPYVTAGLFTLDNIIVNTDLVPEDEIPTTWTDLADARWQGQMLSNDPRTVFTTLSIYSLLADTYGMELVEALGQQDTQRTESLVTAAQIVAAGERQLAYGIGQIHLNVMLRDAPDAPVELVRMEGPAFGAQWNVALANSCHPDAARLFANWLFTPEGQEVFNQIIGPSVLPGVEIEGFPPLGDNYVPLIATTPEEHQDIIEALGLG